MPVLDVVCLIILRVIVSLSVVVQQCVSLHNQIPIRDGGTTGRLMARVAAANVKATTKTDGSPSVDLVLKGTFYSFHAHIPQLSIAIGSVAQPLLLPRTMGRRLQSHLPVTGRFYFHFDVAIRFRREDL
jgi:hypothetical protein